MKCHNFTHIIHSPRFLLVDKSHMLNRMDANGDGVDVMRLSGAGKERFAISNYYKCICAKVESTRDVPSI